MVNTAIILAGGKGERLRPLTNNRPKVMVEVAGHPILYWQIKWLKSHGVNKFVLTVSYKYEVIQDYFKDNDLGVEIDYSIEEEPLGRGGAIKQAFKSKFVQGKENVVATNGDIITKFDLSQMIKKHEDTKSLVTMLLVPHQSRWGIAKLDEEDHILGFEEKPRLPYWINGGIYVFNKSIEPMLPEIGDHEKETFPKIAKEKFLGYKDEGFWRAVDVVKDRSEAEAFLETGQEKFS
ncbi:nucleotidyltransferase family protein [Candidatus Daviesbacteria bacterium]|nr:nucleotidyltransferase family protein [Candidatus Daviesbacteria bacterium]